MRRTLTHALFAAAITTVAFGCGDKSAPPSGHGEPKAEAAKPSADKAAEPKVDVAATKAMLQGTWAVKSAKGKDQYTFKIDGDGIEVTDLRFSEPKTQKGALEIKGAHELGVKQADGTTYKYAFAKIGDVLYLGMGTVLESKSLDTFELKLGMFDKIVKDEKGCRWVKSFGGKDETREIACSVADKGGKQVLKYQVPDNFEPTKLSDRELFVFGEVLIDEELMNSVAHKQ